MSNLYEFDRIVDGQFGETGETRQDRYHAALNNSYVLSLCQAAETGPFDRDEAAFQTLVAYLGDSYRLDAVDAEDIYRILVVLERGEIE